jgi:hypothetical protein
MNLIIRHYKQASKLTVDITNLPREAAKYTTIKGVPEERGTIKCHT